MAYRRKKRRKKTHEKHTLHARSNPRGTQQGKQKQRHGRDRSRNRDRDTKWMGVQPGARGGLDNIVVHMSSSSFFIPSECGTCAKDTYRVALNGRGKKEEGNERKEGPWEAKYRIFLR